MNWTLQKTLTLICAFMPLAACAETVSIGAAKDNSIFQSNSNNSGGASPGIYAGTNASGSPRRGLIAFDIAGNVPAGSTITAVALSMYLGNAQNENSQEIELHRLTRDWGEGTAGSGHLTFMGSGQGFAANPGDATWTDARLGVESWTSPGAEGDFITAASASTPVGGPEESGFTWSSTASLVSDVQGWLDAPATNFGWAIINANESTLRTFKAFYSREAIQNSSGVANSLDPTWRPMLSIIYVTSTTSTGDYNGNGIVDAADYVIWQTTYGQPANPDGSGADGDRSGTIDNGDYDYWRARFGTLVTGFASAFVVPEPGNGALLVMGALAFFSRRR